MALIGSGDWWLSKDNIYKKEKGWYELAQVPPFFVHSLDWDLGGEVEQRLGLSGGVLLGEIVFHLVEESDGALVGLFLDGHDLFLQFGDPVVSLSFDPFLALLAVESQGGLLVDLVRCRSGHHVFDALDAHQRDGALNVGCLVDSGRESGAESFRVIDGELGFVSKQTK